MGGGVLLWAIGGCVGFLGGGGRFGKVVTCGVCRWWVGGYIGGWEQVVKWGRMKQSRGLFDEDGMIN